MANPIVIGLDADSSIGCQFLLQQLQPTGSSLPHMGWDIKRTISRRGLETRGVFQLFFILFLTRLDSNLKKFKGQIQFKNNSCGEFLCNMKLKIKDSLQSLSTRGVSQRASNV